MPQGRLDPVPVGAQLDDRYRLPGLVLWVFFDCWEDRGIGRKLIGFGFGWGKQTAWDRLRRLPQTASTFR